MSGQCGAGCIKQQIMFGCGPVLSFEQKMIGERGVQEMVERGVECSTFEICKNVF